MGVSGVGGCGCVSVGVCECGLVGWKIHEAAARTRPVTCVTSL